MILGLRHGDCLTELHELADGAVDVTITDPPYSERLANARGLDGQAEGGAVRPHDFGYEALTAAERSSAAFQIGRITKRWALIFCDVEGLSDWIAAGEAAGMRYIRCGAWVRHGAPQTTGDRPAVGFEAIAIFHCGAGRMRWNGGGSDGVWTAPVVHASRRRKDAKHTTPKPLPLLEKLVRLFSDPGELICDPFAGSGTTGVAAVLQGRRFVGWEKDAGFAADARRRLEKAKHQLDLFERPVVSGRKRRRPKQLSLEAPSPTNDVAASRSATGDRT